MTFEEQLVRYLDGHCAPIDEEEMMAQMAVSPEKRELMRTHLRMREAMARDRAALRPSRELREQSVGLLLATASLSRPAPSARIGRGLIQGIAGRTALAIAGVAVGSAATFAVLSPRLDAPPTAAPLESPSTRVPEHPSTQSPGYPATRPPESPATRPPGYPVTRLPERIAAPETVRVASAPIVVHDTLRLTLPPARMIAVPPTVTIERETVYVAPRR